MFSICTFLPGGFKIDHGSSGMTEDTVTCRLKRFDLSVVTPRKTLNPPSLFNFLKLSPHAFL